MGVCSRDGPFVRWYVKFCLSKRLEQPVPVLRADLQDLTVIPGMSASFFSDQFRSCCVARFECRGLDRPHIMPGATEFCRFLDARQIRCCPQRPCHNKRWSK